MTIAIDITPIKGDLSGHKVRGVGFYLEYLKRSLLQYYPNENFVFFARGETIDNSVDLVHYPYFEPFFVTLPFFDSHKRVITVHDLTPLVFPQHFQAGLKGNLRWQVQKKNLQRSAGILTDSDASKKDIEKIAGVSEKKISVAYLAAADEFKKLERGKWQEALLKKYQIPEKFVLYVGDVTWNKNLPRLIQAIKEINVTLVLVGKTLAEENFDKQNPWNKDLIESHKLMQGDKRFIKLGFLQTEELVQLYNSATVFVMPSVYEGFGLPVVEAMQCGTPVVTTKGGSLAEVAGEAAQFVDGYNSTEIANGIGEVFFTEKLRYSLSEKGLKQAKKFSWKKTAEDTIAMYKKVLSE